METEYAFKICLFGDSGVGKTTLTTRYLTGDFKINTRQTMGAQIFVKYLDIDGIRVVLQIWDFGGEQNFKFLLPNYAVGSSGGIFMYDISHKITLESTDEWISLFNENLMDREIPIMMIGGKSDLEDERQVPYEDALKIARAKGLMKTIESSSLTGKNVELIFEELVRKIMENAGLLVTH